VIKSACEDAWHADRPWILTCRSAAEGGQFPAAEERRLDILETLAGDQNKPNYVDLEFAAALTEQTKLLRHRTKLILSSHDFQGRPDRLLNLLIDMDAAPCDVKKLAWTARTIRDNLEAFEFLRRPEKPTIALCMGEAGVISRILAKKFGAFLTFASLSDESATAPGQVSIADMKELYRWDKTAKQTKVYGVVAHPVGHSMSPAIHNAAFDATDYDGIYLPLLVNPGYESFKAFMETFVPFEGLDLSGLSVTLPHKENALRYLQEKGGQIEELAARIGAVNTILIDRAGGTPKLSGINTDYAAILDSITLASGIQRARLKDMRVAVLGAGGTGRTATAALAHFGAKVTIYNRTLEKAEALAAEFGATAQPWEKLGECDGQIYVNATSVGIHPRAFENPFGDQAPKLGRDSVVFDTIYNPMRTRLIVQAAAAGAKTVGGVEMFVQQAMAQFTAWTKLPAPKDVMRRVIEARLSATKSD
jgi:3-dehydroquinate dehydratase / shikimate dehydrogenase